MVKLRYLDLQGAVKRECTVEAPQAFKTLLDICDETPLKLPYGCRAGSCGVCRVHIVEGAELLGPVGFIEEDTLERCQGGEKMRLACQATVNQAAQGTLILQMPPEIK